jgi:riboflavin kinase/FMN adenylyltransferase
MANPVFLSEVVHDKNTVLTVGTFDGVHKGHRALIQKLITVAKQKCARSVVVTFDPHPREVINAGTNEVKLITTLRERAKVLNDLGVDMMVVIPFTRDFSLLTSSEFIEGILLKKVGISGFIIGYDHQFGRNREGTISSVQNMGSKHNFDVHIVEAQEIGESTVSSTLIRKTLENSGEVDVVRSYLGRDYELSGLVIHGDKRGRTIGFPTANLSLTDVRKVVPKNGVYAVQVEIEKDSTVYFGMMNIGFRPTFTDDKKRSIEVHLFNFDSDIYGKIVSVKFQNRIRDEKTFGGIEELVKQLNLDRESCLKLNK